MAWIESHQGLGRHPKTIKMARLLDIHRMQAIGHLHALWWWALDYADDGDLSAFSDEDIAIGAQWDGEPETFVAALRECGPGGAGGFIDENRHIHDWWEYAGKLVARRKANRERMKKTRAAHVQDTNSARSGFVQSDSTNPTNRTVPTPERRAAARAMPKTDQQARVQRILDLLPKLKPGRAAQWLKAWDDDAALLRALAAIVKTYPDKNANYVAQVLESARKAGKRFVPPGGERADQAARNTHPPAPSPELSDAELKQQLLAMKGEFDRNGADVPTWLTRQLKTLEKVAT